MDRQQFFKELKFALRRQEYRDVEAIIEYYEEIIMERRESGESEEAIIASFDPIEKIAANVERDISKAEKKKSVGQAVSRAVDEPGVKNYSKAVILLCTLPVTIPLLIAFISIAFALTVATLSVVISLWAVCISLIASGGAVVIAGIVAGVASGAWMLIVGSIGAGLIVFAIGMFSLGLTNQLCLAVFRLSARVLKRMFGLSNKGKKEKNNETSQG